MNTVFFVFEIIGVVAFALSGALLAHRMRMDVLGVCVMGLATAVGGGTVRDLMLGVTPPTSLTHPIFSLVAIVVSAFTFLPFMQKFFSHRHTVYDRLMLVADAIGLGVFTVMGVSACFTAYETPSLFMCVFLGVITGVGGGILRDIMSRSTPYIFVKHFYATAAIVGALLTAVLWRPLGELLAMLCGIGVIILLRILAATFRWRLPKSRLLAQKPERE